MRPSIALTISLLFQITLLIGEEVRESLKLIVVHESPFENSKPIAVKELEIEGFQAAKPDLELSKLQGVTMLPGKQNRAKTDNDRANSADGIDEPSRIQVQLTNEDQQKFATVLAGAAAKRILICMGDRPLVAPYVQDDVKPQFIQIALDDEDMTKKVFGALSLLIEKQDTEQGAAGQAEGRR